MSKYIVKAQELLSRIQSLIDAFVLHKGTSGWPDYYDAKAEIKSQYPDVLTDVQTLLFCDSPEHPLYIQTTKLKSPIELENRYYNAHFSYSDFEMLKNILLKYIEYREFLEADD